jgi:hypothetical protein
VEDFGIDPAALRAEDWQQYGLEQLSAFDSDDVMRLSAEVRQVMDMNDIRMFDNDALRGFNAEDIDDFPPGAIPWDEIVNFRGDALQGMTDAQLEAFTDEDIAQMPSDARAKLMANLNPNDPDQAKHATRFVPEGCEVDPVTFRVTTCPPETPRALPSAQPPQNERLLVYDDMPDLSRGFGVGGYDDESAADGINRLLQEFGLSAQPASYGRLDVGGSEELTAAGFLGFAFKAESQGMQQAPEGTEPGISLNVRGQFVLTLGSGEQIPLAPGLHNPDDMVELDPDGEFEIYEEGHVRYKPDKNNPDNMWRMIPKPEVMTDCGEREPGMYREGEGKEEHGIVVYSDGSCQELRPAIQSPTVFEQLAKQTVSKLVPDMEISVESQADGTVKIIARAAGQLRRTVRRDDVSITVTPAIDVIALCNLDQTASLVETYTTSEGTAYFYLLADGNWLYVDMQGNCQTFAP